MKRFLVPALILFACATAQAQPGCTPFVSDRLHTFRCLVNSEVGKLPVIQLRGSDQLQYSFDELTHEYHRFTYLIAHCDYAGNSSDALFESDYASNGGEEEVVEDYRPSINTSVLYNHYSLTIPNERLRPLLSGNYRLTVYADNEEGEKEKVAETYFGVVDTQMRLSATCTTNTDVDWNEAHQQIEMTADLGALPLRDAHEQFKVIVLQNGRYDNAVTAPAPTSQSAQVLRWEHCRDLIFKAGNEYRKMEFLSHRYPGMHGESMQWFEPYYNYTLFADAPRRNYLYDEDQDGISVVRSQGSSDPDVEADYALTHFTLQMPRMEHAEMYVNGRWATGGLQPYYRMSYNAASGSYEAALLLKQGYYNYLYLSADASSPSVGSTSAAEGDWFQTENEYDFLSYYRAQGARYWQLIGHSSLKFVKK